MLDTREIHSLTDFLRNHEVHVARLKQTRAPEVLTVTRELNRLDIRMPQDNQLYASTVKNRRRDLRAIEADRFAACEPAGVRLGSGGDAV